MARGSTRLVAMSDEELTELLSLLDSADSVELKLTVPDSRRATTAQSLGADPLDAQIRQVYFFDTPDLVLDKHGVVLRARRVQKRGDDSVVKLRPVVPTELPPDVRASPNVVVELDAMPGGHVCSASMRADLGTGVVRESLAKGKPLRKLFTKEQRAFYEAYAPEGVAIDDLAVLGPITVLKLTLKPAALGRRLVGELWTYPDGSRVIELSTKCAPEETFRVAIEARAFLAEHGISVAGRQRTKTRQALTYFSRELAAAGA
jgi:hypothetical protein